MENFQKALLQVPDDELLAYTNQAPDANKSWGANKPVDTRNFQQYDKSNPTVKQQLQAARDALMRETASLPMELGTLPLQAIQNTRARFKGVAAGLGSVSAGGNFNEAYTDARDTDLAGPIIPNTDITLPHPEQPSRTMEGVSSAMMLPLKHAQGAIHMALNGMSDDDLLRAYKDGFNAPLPLAAEEIAGQTMDAAIGKHAFAGRSPGLTTDLIHDRKGLQPALRAEDGRTYTSTSKDTHYNLAKDNNLDPYAEDGKLEAGFTSNGKDYFNRQKAMDYVQRKEPEVYEQLQKEYANGNTELESSSYGRLKGYDQSEALNKMTNDFESTFGAPEPIEAAVPKGVRIVELQQALRDAPTKEAKIEIGKLIKQVQAEGKIIDPANEKWTVAPIEGQGTFQSMAKLALENPRFPEVMSGKGFKKLMNDKGVTTAEMQDTGLLFPDDATVRKADALKLIDEKGYRFGEDVLGKDKSISPEYQNLMDENNILIENMENYRRSLAEKFPDLATMEGQVPLRKARNFSEYKAMEAKHDEVIQKLNYFDTKLAESKPPHYESYKAIPGDADPGTYRETFVTADNVPVNIPSFEEWIAHPDRNMTRRFSKEEQINIYERTKQNLITSWKDEHAGYNDVNNPVVRIRYDDMTQPDGRKIRRIHEIQEPQPVRQSRGKGGQVPQSIADRALDTAVKKIIAGAKADGIDGVTWSTGAQQVKLYDSALAGVADEARWNPETQKLTIYKNGRISEKAQAGIPERVPAERLGDYIPKNAAEKLLKSEPEEPYLSALSSLDKEGYFDISDSNDMTLATVKADTWYEALAKYEENNNLGSGEHIVTDLTMDAKWPGKLYGDFEGSQKVGTKSILPEMSDTNIITRLDDYNIDINEILIGEHGMNESTVAQLARDISKSQSKAELIDKYGDAVNDVYDILDDAVNTVGVIDLESGGAFNTKAVIPSLFEKYGKGKVEVEVLGGKGKLERYIVQGDTENGFAVYDSVRKEIVDAGYKTSEDATKDIKAMWGDASFESGINQPVMWLNKDTPSSFPLYEGVTGILRMLQDQIKNEGGGAKGTAKVAIKIGIPATILATWLAADESKQKNMLERPMYAKLKTQFTRK